jgi:hypothetical protein
MSKLVLVSKDNGNTFLFGYSSDGGKTFPYDATTLKIGDRFKLKRFRNLYFIDSFKVDANTNNDGIITAKGILAYIDDTYDMKCESVPQKNPYHNRPSIFNDKFYKDIILINCDISQTRPIPQSQQSPESPESETSQGFFAKLFNWNNKRKQANAGGNTKKQKSRNNRRRTLRRVRRS